MEALGQLVRARRRQLGLTQAEAADLADVGARFVYEVEHGSEAVQLDKLMRLLHVVGLHLTVQAGAGDGVEVVTP